MGKTTVRPEMKHHQGAPLGNIYKDEHHHHLGSASVLLAAMLSIFDVRCNAADLEPNQQIACDAGGKCCKRDTNVNVGNQIGIFLSSV